MIKLTKIKNDIKYYYNYYLPLAIICPWMYHIKFKDLNNYLAIKSKDGYDKFCSICSYKAQGKKNKLLQHLSG